MAYEHTPLTHPELNTKNTDSFVREDYGWQLVTGELSQSDSYRDTEQVVNED